MQEKIIETKSCKQCNSSFEITDKDLEFYKKISPKFEGKVYEIPTPTLCYECRQQRRWSFRNETNLYKNKCSITGKNIISVYSQDKPYKVVDQNIWWSDKFDSSDYNLEINQEKSFFEQFDELSKKVPRISLYGQSNENCDYTFDNNFSKDNYLTFACDDTEGLLYSSYSFKSKDSLDSFWLLFNCSNIYESLYISNSTNIKISYKIETSRNLIYCKNCTNCEDCIGCKNLNSKRYCIKNKEYSKKDYEIEKKKYEFLKKGDLDKEFKDFFKKLPNKNLYLKNCENSTGDHLQNAKDCINCYGGENIKDCKNVVYLADGNDLYDGNDIGYGTSLIYEGQTVIKNNSRVLFSSFMMEGNYDCLYSMELKGCKNCFGCIGLKHKEYHILNKEYTKEQYNKLVPKIIEKMKIPHQNYLLQGEGEDTIEWGEFFPSSISPFGYNETVAQEYFPLTREEVVGKYSETSSGGQSKLVKGKIFNWSDYETPFPKVEKIIPAEKLPEDITKIPDDILNRAIECEVSGKPFRIIKQELEFYRKHDLPIPRKHPDQRHLERMKLRNPRKLFERECDKCSKNIKSTYAPDRKEIVYCKECYEKEVY